MSLAVDALLLHRADGVCLLGPLSFSLTPGERLGLVGESGSGKSLLIQAIFGVLPRDVIHTGGVIAGFGTSPGGTKDPTRGGRLTWVPQEPLQALNPLLTLAEHLALLPGIHRQESPRVSLARLTPLLERLSLSADPGFLARYPHQVSGGQRQRICLAMALSCDPELLVLDEPTTALDVLMQRDFLDLLEDLQRERGMGTLWITHDLALAAEVSDRLLVLYGGEVMESGPTARLLTAPRHPYTARLLEAARRDASRESGFLPAPQDRPAGCPFQPRCTFRQASCATWGPWRGDPGQGLRCEFPMPSPD